MIFNENLSTCTVLPFTDLEGMFYSSNNGYTIYLTKPAKDIKMPYINNNRQIFMSLPSGE